MQSEQHSPNDRRVAGNKLYCLNGTTGQVIWWAPSAAGDAGQPIIGDNLLFVQDSYTGNLDCYGKGPTAVNISVPLGEIANGDSTWINGRILDQSNAQKDTPCVADSCMGDWIAYLHGGALYSNIINSADILGVPLTLTAISSNGTAIPIGTVTSDSNGDFSYQWTPPAAGDYKVVATFAGDDSYFDSWASTDLASGRSTISSTNSSTTAAPANYTPMFAGVIAAVIVAIILSALCLLLMLRQHK